MADTIWAATFFFESEQQPPGIGTGASVGWTETWYKTFSDAVSPEAVLLDKGLSDYVTLRILPMSALYNITFLRVSDVNNPRRFKIRHLPAAVGAIGLDASTPAQVQCAVLADLEKLPLAGRPTEHVHHRRFLVRGLPSSLINGNVMNTVDPAFTALQQFLALIGNKPAGGEHPKLVPVWTWGIKYQAPTQPKTTITLARVHTPNDHEIVVAPQLPGGTARKSKVIVSGVDAPSAWNRIWTFLANTTQDEVPVSVLGTTRQRQFGTYDGPGRGEYQVVSWEAGPVDQYALIGLRNKKTGRVFRQLRGRSSSR